MEVKFANLKNEDEFLALCGLSFRVVEECDDYGSNGLAVCLDSGEVMEFSGEFDVWVE